VVFYHNAADFAGALGLIESSFVVIEDDVQIIDNAASYRGGAIEVGYYSEPSTSQSVLVMRGNVLVQGNNCTGATPCCSARSSVE
jgi:hypothetical protein